MNKKRLVVALAALSLTGASFAAHTAKHHAITTTTTAAPASDSSHVTPIQAALNGNSYAGYVPHTYVQNNGQDTGLWLGAYGQLTGAYNTNGILFENTTIPTGAPTSSSFTVALPAVDVMVGYTSNHVGMFTDVSYSQMPQATANTVSLVEKKDITEAYLTYTINDMFAVKAGKFISDFTSYDPTAPLVSALVVGSHAVNNVTGVEGVVAANGFHGSLAGVMLGDGTKLGTTVTNDARPNTVIVNGGYDMPLAGGTAGIEGGYTNNGDRIADNATTTATAFKAAWTVGGHFDNSMISAKAGVLNTRAKDPANKTPFVFDGSADYKLGNKFGHGMIVGGYGDYMTHSEASSTLFNNIHWILGAKFGYDVNSYVNATAYVQHAAVQKDYTIGAQKANTTAMVALTVKV
jgi:hypothetical protein